MKERSKLTIKQLPEERRPREKLLKYGAQSLSDAELLALLIATGTTEKTAIELGEELLQRYQSFKGMANRSLDEIMQVKGIKEAKAINIAAAFEIARRVVLKVLEEREAIEKG